VKRISKSIYEDVRSVLKERLHTVSFAPSSPTSSVLIQVDPPDCRSGHRTLATEDRVGFGREFTFSSQIEVANGYKVIFALRRLGRPIWGFDPEEGGRTLLNG
jgi:hypothetical protein